jgi:hypothetical protein
MKDAIFTFIIVYMSIVALYKEREFLGCKGNNFLEFLFRPDLCDNKNNQISRIIRDEKPKDVFKVYDRIVIWRRSYLLSLLIVLFYHYLNNCEYDPVKMLMGIICGTFFIYFSFGFYDYHLNKYIRDEINNNYDISLK